LASAKIFGFNSASRAAASKTRTLVRRQVFVAKNSIYRVTLTEINVRILCRQVGLLSNKAIKVQLAIEVHALDLHNNTTTRRKSGLCFTVRQASFRKRANGTIDMGHFSLSSQPSSFFFATIRPSPVDWRQFVGSLPIVSNLA
jgi:hypothetical protein